MPAPAKGAPPLTSVACEPFRPTDGPMGTSSLDEPSLSDRASSDAPTALDGSAGAPADRSGELTPGWAPAASPPGALILSGLGTASIAGVVERGASCAASTARRCHSRRRAEIRSSLDSDNPPTGAGSLLSPLRSAASG